MVARLGKAPKNICFAFLDFFHTDTTIKVRIEFQKLFDILVHPNDEGKI